MKRLLERASAKGAKEALGAAIRTIDDATRGGDARTAAAAAASAIAAGVGTIGEALELTGLPVVASVGRVVGATLDAVRSAAKLDAEVLPFAQTLGAATRALQVSVERGRRREAGRRAPTGLTHRLAPRSRSPR